MSEENSMTYIARASCGCIMVATIDNPEHKKEVAKEIAKAIRLGETVERMPTEQLRGMDWYCETHKAERAQSK